MKGLIAGRTASDMPGLALADQAMVTYAHDVRANFLGPLSRPQINAMQESCRRINAPLKRAARATKPGRD